MEENTTETAPLKLDPRFAREFELWNNVTAREREIAAAIGTGETNRSIAERLKISIKTVDTHRGHILKKVACKNNVELCLFLLRIGVISIDVATTN